MIGKRVRPACEMPSLIARASSSSVRSPMPVSGSGVRFGAVANATPSAAQVRPVNSRTGTSVRPPPAVSHGEGHRKQGGGGVRGVRVKGVGDAGESRREIDRPRRTGEHGGGHRDDRHGGEPPGRGCLRGCPTRVRRRRAGDGGRTGRLARRAAEVSLVMAEPMDMERQDGRGFRPGTIAAGVILLAAGTAMYLDTTGGVDIHVGRLFAPLVLITLGTAMLD